MSAFWDGLTKHNLSACDVRVELNLNRLERKPPTITIRHGGESAGAITITPSDARELVLVLQRGIRAMRNKDWNACPYESHADDCECRGMGGDR